MTSRLLALHASYRCRHRGVCCSEEWAIPVERVRHRRILDALDAGTLRPSRARGALFEPARGIDADADVVVGRRDRECVFYETHLGRLCAIHRDLGPGMLPAACQHFPRVVVLDPRGMSMSLSYVCPTAADLLYDAGPGWHQIVHDGPVVLPGMEWDGLDARDTLPPQVSETLLWDWDALTTFETMLLDALSRLVPERVLAVAAAAVSSLESSSGPLAQRVRLAFLDAERQGGEIEIDVDDLVRLAAGSATVVAAGEWEPGATDEAGAAGLWQRHRPQVARYLASRTVASAVVHHARSARVWSAWLNTACAVLRRSVELEAARAPAAERDVFVAALARADRLLVHRADPARLAAALHARSALRS